MKLKNFWLFLVAAVPLYANAYDSWLIKGRIGKFDTKTTLPEAHLDCTKFQDGFSGEVALTKLFTQFIGVEFGSGLALVKVQKAGVARKNANIMPVSMLAQLRWPIAEVAIPYLGIGAMYRTITNLPVTLKISNATGVVYQFGMDLFVFENIGLNLDVKWNKMKHKISDTTSSNTSRFKMKLATTAATFGVVVSF